MVWEVMLRLEDDFAMAQSAYSAELNFEFCHGVRRDCRGVDDL